MGKTMTTFSDGSYLEYDQGTFDVWCVYLVRPGKAKKAPRDYEYFQRLETYGMKYGYNSIYHDFVELYNRTGKSIEPSIFDWIKEISSKYEEDALNLAIDFSTMYMGMIAEENKVNTRLGKRIKRLGVYQVLIERMPVNEAASFSKGKQWRDLDHICLSKGF